MRDAVTGRVLKPIKSNRRRQALVDSHTVASEKAQARQSNEIMVVEIKPVLPVTIDPAQLPARKFIGRPSGIKNMCKSLMPLCPYCDTEGVVKRAGLADGYQRYKCSRCRHTFGGPGFKVVHDTSINLVCYRCGADHCKNLGLSTSSGRTGYCTICKRRFIQGGRSELARYHLLLEQRVREVVPVTSRDLHDILMQLAYRDVLEGRGYCWNLVMPIKEAKKEFFGTYGQGSDHPYFKLQQGQSSELDLSSGA